MKVLLFLLSPLLVKFIFLSREKGHLPQPEPFCHPKLWVQGLLNIVVLNDLLLPRRRAECRLMYPLSTSWDMFLLSMWLQIPPSTSKHEEILVRDPTKGNRATHPEEASGAPSSHSPPISCLLAYGFRHRYRTTEHATSQSWY